MPLSLFVGVHIQVLRRIVALEKRDFAETSTGHLHFSLLSPLQYTPRNIVFVMWNEHVILGKVTSEVIIHAIILDWRV